MADAGIDQQDPAQIAALAAAQNLITHAVVEMRANLRSISHRCRLFEVAFVWELTKETIHLPMGCLQGGC